MSSHAADSANRTLAEEEEFRRRLVDKADSILPVLRANARDADANNRLPDASLAAMDSIDLFALRAPRRFGGLEADLRTYVDVVAEIGRGCSSAAWITFISTATAWIASLFPDDAQRDIFDGHPGTRFIGLLEPSATTKPADGGYRVTGKWYYASNCLHADWGLFSVPLMDDQGEVTAPGVVLIPAKDLPVETTWFVAGMRGTGSNAVSVDDVFVPSHRVLELPRLLQNDVPRERKDEVVYREDFLLTAILMVVPPMLGMARAALDHTVAAVCKGKKINYTFYDASRDAPSVQLALADAATEIDTAHVLVRHWADEICAAARENRAIDPATRARARSEFGFAIRLCQQAMQRLLDVTGAGAFADSNPIQRLWRDFETASRHGLVSPDMAREMYGRSLVGNEETITPLV